jgi:hypothetical protein
LCGNQKFLVDFQSQCALHRCCLTCNRSSFTHCYWCSVGRPAFAMCSLGVKGRRSRACHCSYCRPELKIHNISE